jgi:hypothetical protein
VAQVRLLLSCLLRRCMSLQCASSAPLTSLLRCAHHRS